MRLRDKKINIKKTNLLMEMRSNLVEDSPLHKNMGDPITAKSAKYGYLGGDSPELLGKSIWFHTNRHNIKNKKNGAFGLFLRNPKGGKESKSGVYGYTNDILLGGDINFDISPGYHEMIRNKFDSGEGLKRSQVVGIGGIVQELPTDTVTFKEISEEIKYDPRVSDFFHTVGGMDKVVGAEFVYAEYRPDGSYSLHAINPILEKFKMGEYNPL